VNFTSAGRICSLLATAAATSLLMTGSDAPTPSAIHDMDFGNFSYVPSCLSVGQSVQVHNGTFYGHTHGGTDGYDFLDFTVEQVAYGRLSGDRREEAVVVTRCNKGGSGAFTSASVYEMRQGKIALVTTLQGGDRADGGIASVGIKGGLLWVDFYGTTGGLCCPQWIETATYRLVDCRLVEAGRRVRKALPHRAISPEGELSQN